MSDLNGQTVAGYPIQKLLAKGSYVELYQAASSGSPLAVRVLRDDLRANNLLKTSVIKGWENARSVQHANLKVMFSAGEDPLAGAYTLEEMIAGKSMRQMLMGGSKVAWRDCIILAEQLFSAIAALHHAGKIHGEIWPGGILITQDQDLKLEGAGGLTMMNMPLIEVINGPAAGYLAPEVIEGSPLSVESDIYAAGAVLHFIMAGQDPFPGEDADVIGRAVLERKPSPLSALRDDVPPEAEQFIARLMGKDTAQRYGLVDDILADLQRLKSGQPTAPLKGGKPPAPPRPIRKAPAFTSSASLSKAPSAGDGQSARESSNALKAASEVKKTTGFLTAIKGATPNARVFGRLETHVKSTIPQSDTEKRGDDFYRQGQLPLAVSNWKEAFGSGTPHAALKIKIELGEREVKKEAYEAAIDEAKHRIYTGDFKAAINRAREAMVNCDSEQQRQEAINLEHEAIAKSQVATKSGNTKLIAAVVGFILVVIFVFKFFAVQPDERDAPVESTPDGPATEVVIPKAGISRFNIHEAQASVLPPPQWVVKDNKLVVLTPTTKNVGVSMHVTPQSGSTAALKLVELRNNPGLKESVKIEDLENFALVDGLYPVSELAFRYKKPDGAPALRYHYLIAGPKEALYRVEFDGIESIFASVQGQLRQIILSWTYKKQ